MFYQDFFYRDFRKIQPSKNDKVLIDDDNRTNVMILELRIPKVAGVPIPQNATMKGAILKRSLVLTFFDMSAESAKHCITSI